MEPGISDSVLIAGIAMFSALFAGFFKLLNDQNKIHAKLGSSMDKVADSNHQIADETKKGNREAKERNGHLGEQSEKIVKQRVPVGWR